MAISASAAIIGSTVVGGAMQYAGAQQAGRAARGAAEARLRQERADRKLALEYAQPSPEEIAAINNSIAVNERDIANKERLLASVDPVIMESMTQALNLLKGEEAAMLDPIKKRREEQRVQLQENLKRQLGPGYETSAIGQRALAQYDSETDMNLAMAQDQAVGRLLGVAQNTRQFASLSPNIQNMQNSAALLGGIKNRQISAITGTPLNNVGAQFVSGAVQGQMTSQFGGQVAQAGTTAAILGGLSSPAGPTGTMSAGQSYFDVSGIA